ncbi:MAG: outer membrane beta-barrel protein [Saprospiraceae bacterium]
MRIVFLVILFYTIAFPLSRGQSLSIDATIIDDQGKPIFGVNLDLIKEQNIAIQSQLTDSMGYAKFTNIAAGKYKLQIKYLGTQTIVKQISIQNFNILLGNITLLPDTKLLKEVVIKDKKPLGSIKNDTVQFDANSFKMMNDATADQLVEKMPSINKENGTLKAQGDEVKQILVDGKPFFGNDPNLSLRNLPAELIDKVQIFDQLSEQSQFTGINDGNTVKTINIVTKNGMNNGQFGKLYAGYGVHDKYQIGTNLNFFDGNRRVSLIGMSNNVNIQNFAVDDILGAMGNSNNSRNRSNSGNPTNPRREGRGPGNGINDFLVPQSGGIAKTNAVGINYTDKLGSKIELNLSYFYNLTSNNIENDLDRTYLTSGFLDQHYFESTNSKPKNVNHRLNGRVEYKMDSFNTLIFRPRITIQLNKSGVTSESGTYLNDILTNHSLNTNNSEIQGSNISNSLLFRHRFAKIGRSVSIDLNHNIAPKTEDLEQNSVTTYETKNKLFIDTINQRSDNAISKWSLSSNIEYTEPVTLEHSVVLNYKMSYQEDETDLSTYDISLDGLYGEQFNSSLSNHFTSNSKSHQVGLGYQFNREQKLNLSSRIHWQTSKLLNQQYIPIQNDNNKIFNNILPSLFLRYTPTRTKSFNLHYRSTTQLPTINQLQNVLNNSNPVQLSIGNPNLKQAVNHNFNIRYSSSNANSSMIYLMLGGTITQNYISNHLYIRSRNHPIFNIIDLPIGSQLSIPENYGISKQYRAFCSYSFPIPKIKCNLSLDASYIYSKAPSLVDSLINRSTQNNTSLGISLSSNINQKIDFNIQFRPSYNNYTSKNIEDNYFYFENKVRFAWQFYNSLIIRMDLNSKSTQSLTDRPDQTIWLFNLAFGKKIFKNERGEIAIGVNDLFNQNINILQSVSDYYVEDSRTNSLQRFLMISFTYNIRNYNSGKKATQNNTMDQDRMRRWDERRN